MRDRLHSIAAAVLLALTLAGCCCPPQRCQATAVVRVSTTLEGRAHAIADQARAAEPGATALLQRLAQEMGGELMGLEHRLKTPSALRSKLTRLTQDGEALADVEVYDALRYTLLLADDPAGAHDRDIRTALARFEAEGHVVEVVKNYWPGGDTYAGVNVTLRLPSGLPWELQFHTRQSYATKDATHDDYEIFRAPATPLERRRGLYDKMRAIWDAVRVPVGILEPGSLHARETLKTYARP